MILTESEINSKITNLNGWYFIDNHLEKKLEVKNFLTAIKIVNQISVIAEAVNHHPDILIYSWNKIKIMISTHNEGGVTIKDFQLAEKIELELNAK
ncbi:MAG: 4a-hydroxytetrahydrobiopterin dehydratase [Chlorobiaceae bacterium]|nr:4a-hydroxytetrahydrobiopterin dehydratase [Chlorobiaceae bacterium]MBA4308769.1 4a-hydroxytetrahydrobiopterin dehydratase [Chlorobiaceae bacterium]